MIIKELIEELSKYNENTEIEFVRTDSTTQKMSVYPKCVIFDHNKKVVVQLFNEYGW